jgi:DMSO/TMAO reductase YedYZ molybdopterin-dependent catalytic subunit
MQRRVFVTAAIVSIASSITLAAWAQTGQSGKPLQVTGDVRTPLTLTVGDLKAMPRTRVDVKDEGGRLLKYEGVLVGEILKKAGATLGTEMRGGAMATYVVANASDGYQVIFSLAELDPVLTGSEIIVADTIDGEPLSAKQGPLRIVAPKDTRPARSLRMLERLDVVRLKEAAMTGSTLSGRRR